MSAKFLNEMVKEDNYKVTEKGAVAYSSTLNSVLDAFGTLGAMRSRSEEDIITTFNKAWIENKELADALNLCIDKLPESQKQLILLKLVEEEETEVVCKELNITPTNYWVIIHRAKLQLRSCLEKNWIKA